MGIDLHKKDQLNQVLAQFEISDGMYSFAPMTSGLINDTFLVSLSNRPLYVLQRINHNVFQDVRGLMSNIHQALNLLKSTDYTQLHLVKTKEQNIFYTSRTEPIGYWRLMGFIEDTQTFDNAPNEKVAFEAGSIIGAFHTLLEKSEPSTYVDTIPRFHDLALRKDQFTVALEHADSEKLDVALSAVEFAKKTIAQLELMHSTDLPLRVCHNDTKLNNILFSKKNDKALCLIDLDTIMAGYFLYDFGDAVRTIANTAAEDEQNHTKITFDKNLFEAFVMGLATNATFLSKKEILSLPSGIILMPFLHGLRALTDYLENNRYYKVSYENQNLDRALSLFDFTKKALDELEGISAILHTNLKP